MFRKLVSNLAFSPALVGQLGFYAKRLRKEEATRRMGLIFTALALVVQSFAVFQPPEAANASNPSNFIQGGVSSLAEYIKHYDQNTNNIKDLLTILGITRTDLSNARATTVNSKDVYSWGLTSHFSYAQGERTYTIKTANGGTRTFYYRPLSLWDSLPYTIKNGSTYKAWEGTTKSGMYFSVSENCGNLMLKIVPPAPKCPTGQTGTYPNCTTPPPMCKIPGKEQYLASDTKNCVVTKMCTIPGKTQFPATDTAHCVPDAVAKCDMLKITKLVNTYQMDATASTQYGAKITGYVYTIKKDGKVVKTQTVISSASTNTYRYTTTAQGAYSVILTVKTSLGDKTDTNCAKTFNIPAPAMCPQNPSLRKDSPECQPCPGDTTLWIKDENCAASVMYTKSAKNITQGNVDAITTTAKAGDKIVYTLKMSNSGKADSTVTPTEKLADIAEYAQVIDLGSGTYDAESKTLTWPALTLKAGETQTRMFTVKLADVIPAIATGSSDKTSYDCRMDNTFGNIVSINVDCPVQKQVVEQTVSELPHTGPRENIIFASIFFAIVAYFYARSRQVKKEIRLIRRDLNAGTI